MSGLPLPRFVSLKSDEVNVRRGAGKEHDVLWTYHRAGLPVEIIAEWDNWRRIRDADGADGWVFHSLLSGRRSALVAPWATEPTLPLRRSAELHLFIPAGGASQFSPFRLVDMVRDFADRACVNIRLTFMPGAWNLAPAMA